jgi:hypothetical protein
MFRHCLFCDAPFPLERVVEGLPHGSRIAYDPERFRLWLVCDVCHRWTLTPLESRYDAIEALERLVRDRGRLGAQTSHIALYHADPLVLVRVGEAGRTEAAWWRYGRELVRRHEWVQRRGVRWGAASLAAVARVGETLGLNPLELDPTRTDSPTAAILRLRFGPSAWEGRARCPFCHSVLLTVPFDFTWWLHPRQREGGLEVWVPCTRCDPWTPDNAYRLAGEDARRVLRRALAYQNVGGATQPQIEAAAQRIDHAGAAHRLIGDVSRRRQSLWSLGKAGTLALEIALSDAVEAEQLQAQARALEAEWRGASPIAEIIDTELNGP